MKPYGVERELSGNPDEIKFAGDTTDARLTAKKGFRLRGKKAIRRRQKKKARTELQFICDLLASVEEN